MGSEFEGIWTFGPLDKSDQPVGSYTIAGTINKNGGLTFEGVKWIIDPGNYRFASDFYLHMMGNQYLCGNTETAPIFLEKVDTSETVYKLGMLEEISYPLVFMIPNRVAEDLDNCKVEIIVNGNHYLISLK